jgi:hypothetical protein
MDLELLERVNKVSLRVARALEESEKIRAILCERINQDSLEGYEDEGSQEQSEEEDSHEESEEQGEEEQSEEECEEEKVQDNELSACWFCCNRRR